MRINYPALLCASALLAVTACAAESKASGKEQAPKATAPAVKGSSIELTVTGMR